ncbi:hypothetical protein IL306_000588 [Fusarium sp. DS 682]|nr:hypothetical protein IL306_000588 [Fusarium sp. DS 682]
MPAKAAVAAERRQSERFALCGGLRVHRLQGAEQNAGARSPGAAGDEDYKCRRTHSPRAMRSVQPVRERDLVGNRVPHEMTVAQARLEELSHKTVQEALQWPDDDFRGRKTLP